MKVISLSLLILLVVGCSKEQPSSQPMSKWIDAVVEYNPAPGQFINTTIGKSTSPSDIVGKRGMLTLGGYGGYVVFKFARPIVNGDGADFVIHGNAFGGSSEPGIVFVSVDANGNGIADDKWVELKGSAYNEAIKNYTITYTAPFDRTKAEPINWSDNKGGSGAIGVVDEHSQSYWPTWVGASTMTFTGSRIVNTPTVDDKNQIVMPALEWGYVDNFSSDYMQTIGGDIDTQYANKFDLDNAAEPVAKADFVMVHNCVNEQAGVLGESSTEVCGAIIVNY